MCLVRMRSRSDGNDHLEKRKVTVGRLSMTVCFAPAFLGCSGEGKGKEERWPEPRLWVGPPMQGAAGLEECAPGACPWRWRARGHRELGHKLAGQELVVRDAWA